jgi:hypothetical protein
LMPPWPEEVGSRGRQRAAELWKGFRGGRPRVLRGVGLGAAPQATFVWDVRGLPRSVTPYQTYTNPGPHPGRFLLGCCTLWDPQSFVSLTQIYNINKRLREVMGADMSVLDLGASTDAAAFLGMGQIDAAMKYNLQDLSSHPTARSPSLCSLSDFTRADTRTDTGCTRGAGGAATGKVHFTNEKWPRAAAIDQSPPRRLRRNPITPAAKPTSKALPNAIKEKVQGLLRRQLILETCLTATTSSPWIDTSRSPLRMSRWRPRAATACTFQSAHLAVREHRS